MNRDPNRNDVIITFINGVVSIVSKYLDSKNTKEHTHGNPGK